MLQMTLPDYARRRHTLLALCCKSGAVAQKSSTHVTSGGSAYGIIAQSLSDDGQHQYHHNHLAILKVLSTETYPYCRVTEYEIR